MATHNQTPLSEEKVDSMIAHGKKIAMAAMAYFFGFVTGIVFLITEKEDKFVRFHAMQSTVVSLFFFFLIEVLGWFLGFLGGPSTVVQLVYLIAFISWLVLIVKAYQGEEWEYPVLGSFARDLLKKMK